MIASVDESVGRVADLLDELKLSEKTLVVFSSDNGGVGGYAREGIQGGGAATDNAPLKGGKGMLAEGGIRVPWILRWPGRLAPGTTSDTPVLSVDLHPTLLDVAGLPRDASLDGASVLGPPPARAIYWHFPGYLGAGKGQWRTTPAGAIREGDWKLLEYFEDGRLELYNLKEDLGERRNLAAERNEVAARLHAKLKLWREEVKAPMPAKNSRD
jgi:arylsulfatase A-like enzyme